MKNIYVILIATTLVSLVSFYALNFYTSKENQNSVVTDYQNISYIIDGVSVKLNDGVSEVEVMPGSASKIMTRYFGNEFITDLNADGRQDVVFLLTQNNGGSGTFFYVVAALNIKDGYIGSDGYLLGDRISPQTIGLSQNSRHKNVVVVNYVDRKEDEPMSAQPSVGKSVYLKLDESDMSWGIVAGDFEGEQL